MTRKHPLVTSADGVIGVQPMIKSGCSLDTAFAMRSVSENHDRGVCHHVLGSNVDGQTAEVLMTRVSPAAANPCWERKQVLSFLARADDDPCGGLSRCEQACWNVRPKLRSRFVVQETQRVTTLGHTEVVDTHFMRLWWTARQAWAKPSVRNVLWLVGCPSMPSWG